jgi:hypothetical protein
MDFASLLGATDGASTPQKFIIYLPDRDGHSAPILDIAHLQRITQPEEASD